MESGLSSAAARDIDLVCMGRVAVDLYCEQIGAPLAEAQSFRMYLGGCAGNVAVGSARLGLRVEMFSRVGADELGRFLRGALEREGVGTSMLLDDPEHLSGLVLLGVAPPERFPLIFYRERCADMETRLADVDASRFAGARALLVTGTGMSRPDTAAETLAAAGAARRHGAAVVVDLDYRPVLWGLTPKGDGESRYVDSARVTEALGELLPLASLVVGTDEELVIAGGRREPEDAVAAIRERCSALVVRKRGAAGCRIHAAEGAIDVPALTVDVLNVLGAGDAFLAGFLRGWLRAEELATCGWWGNVNGALVVTRHGCAPAMPSFEEMNSVATAADPRGAARAPALARLHRRTARRSTEELLVLACDHRLPFERDCARAGVGRERIVEFKRLLWRAFERAARDEPAPGAALLVDPTYGGEVLRAATAAGTRLGAPIEAAGALPLAWTGEGSLYGELLARPRSWLVKVLVELHPALPPELARAQLERLRELQTVCDELERELMVEIVPPSGWSFGEGELARLVGEICEAGVDPAWFKVPPQPAEAWRRLDATLAANGCAAGLVVLGGGRSRGEIEASFPALRALARGRGFAVGRSLFGDAWAGFLAGRLGAQAVVDEVAERYRELLRAWHAAPRAALEAR